MPRAPKRSATPFPDVPASDPPASPVVADPLDLVAEVAEPAAPEYISLSPEVTTESISRLLTSDKPLGFEDMALEAQGKQPVAAAPEPAPVQAPAPEPFAPVTNEAGVSLSVLARTHAEQEAGREAVARRTAESVRNREITARENAKRQAEGSAAEAGDLSYNARG